MAWSPRSQRRNGSWERLLNSEKSPQNIVSKRQIPRGHVKAEQMFFLLFLPMQRAPFISFLEKYLSRSFRRKGPEARDTLKEQKPGWLLGSVLPTAEAPAAASWACHLPFVVFLEFKRKRRPRLPSTREPWMGFDKCEPTHQAFHWCIEAQPKPNAALWSLQTFPHYSSLLISSQLSTMEGPKDQKKSAFLSSGRKYPGEL